jgi:hypothetical protein
MSDDPLKKYWQNRAAGQSPIPNSQRQPMMPVRNPDGELNVGQMLQQRILNQMTSSPTNIVQIKDNAPLYRKLNTQGFMEGYTNIVVYLGNSSFEHQNKQFENKGVKSCMLVENQQALVDLSETSSQNKMNLVEISAPFVGTFFIPEQYIIRSTSQRNSSNPSLLKG